MVVGGGGFGEVVVVLVRLMGGFRVGWELGL